MNDPQQSKNADCSTPGATKDGQGRVAGHQPLRLILRPSLTNASRRYGDAFEACLDGELIVTSSQPLYDGARALQALGYADHNLLTMRHHDRGYDSFKPMPIGELAKWTVRYGDKGINKIKWKPMPESLKKLRREQAP